jgi:polysaccharide export outer membrane protein
MMKSASRYLSWILACGLVSGIAWAQQPAPPMQALPSAAQQAIQNLTPTQRQQIESMSPAEQRALAERAGVNPPSDSKPSSDAKPAQNPDALAPKVQIASGNEFETRQLYPGADSLPLFGYDLFSTAPNTFAPANDIPVPADYVLGPGDNLEILIIGERGGRFSLEVTRDGVIDLPQVGPIPVSGMRFLDARALIEERVAAQISAARASVTLGELRSIRVFVLGEARRPGSYTVSGLSTISHALLASGGVKPIGSLRNIELKRNGRTITKLDLYDFLTRGDTSKDQRLLPGDVIFIPPVGATVAISGSVKRSAIFEVTPGTTVKQLVDLAGGFQVNADATQATLNRLSDDIARTVTPLDLTAASDLSRPIKNGDSVRVEFILPTVTGQVDLQGHVFRPGLKAFKSKMTLVDLLPSIDELKTSPDLDYVLIARRNPSSDELGVTSTSLRSAWSNPQSPANTALASGDQVLVFSKLGRRDSIINPLIDSLRNQNTAVAPYRLVTISGAVLAPGSYPHETNMTVSDLIRAGGGLNLNAYTLMGELIRYEVGEDQVRRRKVINVNLQAALAGDSSEDLPVSAFDELSVREIPDWRERSTVEISGEVVFPGVYSIEPGETLSQVIARAGGLKVNAFAEGAFFSRESLRVRELEQLRRLQGEIRRDLARQQSQLASGPDAEERSNRLASLAEFTLEGANDNPALGRLSINLDKIIAATTFSADDLVVQGGDRLFVPRVSSEVSVFGEVLAPSFHQFERGKRVGDYIDFAGGLRSSADKGAIYVISASGRSRVAGSGLLSRGRAEIRPGDAIIVPVEIPKVATPLRDTLREVTQIIYNLALGAAAVDSLSR